MRAIILAGGLGTRLREVLPDLPKPMAPIQGKPFLEYLIHWLKRWDIKKIILCVCYKKEIIMDYFKDGKTWGVTIEYSIEDSPLGTGGALKKAMMQYPDEKFFLVLNGDSFVDVNLNELVVFHNTKKAIISMTVKKLDDTARFGRVMLNENSQVVSFIEKSDSKEGYINTGLYFLNYEIIGYIPNGVCSLERDVFTLFAGNGLYGFRSNGFFTDFGIPESYFILAQNEKFMSIIKGQYNVNKIWN